MARRMTRKDVAAAAILGRRNVVSVIELLQRKGLTASSEMAKTLRLEPPQVYRVLCLLAKYDLVRKHQKASTPVKPWVFYELNARGRRIAQAVEDIRMALLNHMIRQDEEDRSLHWSRR